MMPVMFVFVVAIGVAVIRRRLLALPGDPVASADAPARLVGWAVGLLDGSRGEWGQAMIGELDRLDRRAARWRFAVGCVGAALILPPWGRATAALGAMLAVAASAAGLAAYSHIHYRLSVDGWTWVGAAILVMILAGYILGGSALLRRPGVAGPGLAGGLLVAAAWLTASGVTFNHWLNSVRSGGWLLFPIVASIVVGVGGTLWGGNAAIGRRAARLAAVVAALGVYLYGVLAVAVLGATGHDPSDGWTPAQVVGDNLGNQAVFYLMALPLMTATVGWAAAAATARLRPAPQALATGGPDLAAIGVPLSTSPRSHPREDHPLPARPRANHDTAAAIAAAAAARRRTWYRLLLCAALAASAFLVFLTLLAPH